MSTEPAQTPPQPEPTPFARAMDGNYLSCDYPEDAAHENGNYANKCQCGAAFIGHKRRVICKVCAESPEPAPPQPEPPNALDKSAIFAPFDADGILCVQDGKITPIPDEDRDWTEYHLEPMQRDVWRIEVCPSENTGWTVFRGKIPTRDLFVTIMQNIDQAPPIDWAPVGACRPLPTQPEPQHVSIPLQLPEPSEPVHTATSRFRKKPVVIEAFQITTEAASDYFFKKKLLPFHVHLSGSYHKDGRVYSASTTIVTLEGEMRAEIGDWIIKGVKGELYPCKPDIFEATYEPVSALTPPQPQPEPQPQRCENCDWTFGCFDGSEPCQKKPVQPEPQPQPTCPYCAGEGVVDSGGTTPWGEWIKVPCGCLKKPEPQQSAVEWVSGLLCDGTDLEGNDLAFLLEDNALELAERCEDAEHQAISMRQKADAFEKVAHQLNAQLANAQAEAAEMRKQRDLAGKQVLTLTAEINRLRKGITEIKAGTRIGWFMADLGAKCEKLLKP